MLKIALIIGYGSIGRRHAEILDSMDEIKKVVIYSSQHNLPYETIESLEEIIDLDPYLIVVASETSLHYKQLMFLENNVKEKKILVEKPLYESYKNPEIKNNEVFVGYNLRFHPVLDLIKEKISNKKLWNIQVYCGSYLPDWRQNLDYRESSSAKKKAGGGVLLDLSHELDYVQWLVGSIFVQYVVSQKVSNLEIETDDLLLLSGKTKQEAYLQISLNYFSKNPHRQIIIDGEKISLKADLINNTLLVNENGEISNYDFKNLQRNETYEKQHKALIKSDLKSICTYKEGLKTMKLINNIRDYNNN